MTRLLCAALCLLSGFASVARAADADPAPPPAMPAPAESTPPAAAPGGPPPAEGGAGSAGPVVPGAALAEEAGPQRPADLSYGVAARLRWISIPSWLLNSFTKKNVPLSTWGTGLELFRRKGNFDIMVSFNYQNLSPPDGNWLGKGHDATVDTDYVQFDGLALYGADVSFIWHTLFNEWFGLHYGAGIGVAHISGKILRTSNNPAVCNEQNAGDVSQCNPVGSTYVPGSGLRLSPASLQPGPDDPTNPHRFADPDKPNWLPIVNVLIGVDFRLPQVRGWEAKLEGGFYDAFFLGGGLGYTF